MADGLRVWDAGGTLMFDETSPVIKFLGTATVGFSVGGQNYTGDAKSGSIYDARLTQYSQHVAFWCRIDGKFDSGGFDATWRQEGNSLIWTYPRAVVYYNGYMYNRPEQTIVYGIR